MKYDNLKKRLVCLYLQAFEAALIKMDLRDTYYFQCYFVHGISNKFLLEDIGIYTETLIKRSDPLFLELTDEEIQALFIHKAEEDINGEINALFEGPEFNDEEAFEDFTDEEAGIIDA